MLYEVITLGVREYLVKPAKRAEVAAVLERLVQEIEAERNKRNEQLAVRDKFSYNFV